MSPDEIENAHQVVGDTDVTQVGILISSRLNIGGVDATLAMGGLVFLYQCVTDCESRQGLSDNLLDDLGISKSQAYRCVDVWEGFGERLINAPQLKAYFVVEALKRLSAVGVCPLAREAAVQMAHQKRKVRIADAAQLVADFAATTEEGAVKQSPKRTKPKATGQKNPQSLRGKKSVSIWEYAGNAVRFVLRPAQSKQDIDHEAIIKDLETALAQYRMEYSRVRLGKTEKAEVIHV